MHNQAFPSFLCVKINILNHLLRYRLVLLNNFDILRFVITQEGAADVVQVFQLFDQCHLFSLHVNDVLCPRLDLIIKSSNDFASVKLQLLEVEVMTLN